MFSARPERDRPATVHREPVWLWDLETGRELHRYRVEGGPSGMAFVPGTRTAYVGTAEGRIEQLDLDGPEYYRTARPAVRAAQAKLATTPDDAQSLRTLGEWYARRGAWDWAVSCLERARKGGATVPAELLAPGLASVERWDDAAREYERMAADSGKSDPQAALHATICRTSLEEARASRERSARVRALARPLRPGRLEAKLDESSFLDGDRRIQVYGFTGYAGEKLEIELAAEGFRPHLVLFPPASAPRAEQGNPKSPAARMVVTLPEDGAYALIAAPAEAGGTGPFVLDFQVK